MDKNDLRQRLTPLQYQITCEGGTEAPFSGKYYKHAETGVYHCVVCATALFMSTTKYDSGSGWPAFYAPVSETAVRKIEDFSHNMHRIEVRCAQCNAHLGHVFPDGPRETTGLRYCINSASLDFQKSDD